MRENQTANQGKEEYLPEEPPEMSLTIPFFLSFVVDVRIPHPENLRKAGEAFVKRYREFLRVAMPFGQLNLCIQKQLISQGAALRQSLLPLMGPQDRFV